MSALLIAQDLAKSYRSARRRPVRAVQGVSLRIAEAEVVALVGESGSGKSTTARLLALLERPSAGTITFAGVDALRLRGAALLRYRAQVQMVFQDPFASLNPVRTVAHHLVRPMAVHGIGQGRADRERRAAALLETVGLAPGTRFLPRFPHELSGGQRQRVAVARALAVEPRLILADEPVSMLDVSIRVGLLRLLARLRVERRLAYLYITHDLATARYFSDRILVMYGGRIVEQGPADEVVERSAHPYTRLLVAAAPGGSGAAGGAAAGGEWAPLASVAAGADDRATPPAVETDPWAARGCVFARRCPLALPACRREPPPRVEVATGHVAECHLLAGP